MLVKMRVCNHHDNQIPILHKEVKGLYTLAFDGWVIGTIHQLNSRLNINTDQDAIDGVLSVVTIFEGGWLGGNGKGVNLNIDDYLYSQNGWPD